MNTSHPIIVYGLLIAIGIFGGIGDSLIFKAARQSHWGALIAGYIAWIICITILAIYFRIDRHGFTALVHTDDEPSQVFAFYKSKLSGMKKTAEVSMGGMQVLTFESAQRRVTITILPDGIAMNPKDGKTGVQIIVDEGT